MKKISMLFAVAIAMISTASFAKTNPHKGEAIYVEEIIETMVQIPGKDYLMGKYEVTQAQWQSIMGDNPSEFTGDLSRPVERVSWNDCQEFIKKLNARTEVKSAGITFRLPTEEEWEYACRAGSTGKYGLLADGREGTMDEMGWYEDNSGSKTHPVGQKESNAWGLYDMHGNVWEWTASAHGSSRIRRGGCIYYSASCCESGYRDWFDPVGWSSDLGFRLVASRTAQVLEIEHKAPVKTEVEHMVSKKAEVEREISVAGIEMVRIPDNATHKGLYFGKYEVTQAQWQAIMGDNPSEFTGDSSRPVEQVSWNDCQEFIKKLNAHTEVKQAGIRFRLPTEEEWEYACRAGSTGDYGLLADGREGTLDEMGWYRDNSGSKTHPVGQKTPNAWGLYDMHGNVWEWTASGSRYERVCRGCSWNELAEFWLVTGYRWNFSLDHRDNYLGFRLAASRTGTSVKETIETKKSVKEIIETMVQIPGKDYLMGKYEVTQAQWQAITGDNPSYFTGDLSRPVEQVSWNDCQEFIEKLNKLPDVKQAGITFRLPTEAEWEYACRAGSTGKYGLLADGREGIPDEMGWYADNSGDKTHPVGQKKPNAWGLYDMHGNVWEWTASKRYNSRVCRGGGGGSYAEDCEAVSRESSIPDDRSRGLGFRLAASRTTEVLETEHKAPMKTEVEREIFVAGIEMVRIPDSSTHKGLYFGKYEVTQAQWQAIMGNNPSGFTGDSSRPVEQVSWNDCQEFIKKLNAHTEVKQAGLTFFLPTEEQWEYACRAGSTGKYGLLADGREGSLDEMGWYKDNSEGKTHPVGQKTPNAWGLYDMHGNVCEWTASGYFFLRFYFGGSWDFNAEHCEAGLRYANSPDYRSSSLGFRLVASRTGK